VQVGGADGAHQVAQRAAGVAEVERLLLGQQRVHGALDRPGLARGPAPGAVRGAHPDVVGVEVPRRLRPLEAAGHVDHAHHVLDRGRHPGVAAVVADRRDVPEAQRPAGVRAVAPDPALEVDDVPRDRRGEDRPGHRAAVPLGGGVDVVQVPGVAVPFPGAGDAAAVPARELPRIGVGAGVVPVDLADVRGPRLAERGDQLVVVEAAVALRGGPAARVGLGVVVVVGQQDLAGEAAGALEDRAHQLGQHVGVGHPLRVPLRVDLDHDQVVASDQLLDPAPRVEHGPRVALGRAGTREHDAAPRGGVRRRPWAAARASGSRGQRVLVPSAAAGRGGEPRPRREQEPAARHPRPLRRRRHGASGQAFATACLRST
jgi:hypothetical protein